MLSESAPWVNQAVERATSAFSRDRVRVGSVPPNILRSGATSVSRVVFGTTVPPPWRSITDDSWALAEVCAE